MYSPKFDNNVTITFTEVTPYMQTPVNPVYCLDSGDVGNFLQALIPILPTGVTVQVQYNFPFGPMGGPFIPSQQVPWLLFTQAQKTYSNNAGLIANYWAHGYSQEYVTQQVQADVTAGLGV